MNKKSRLVAILLILTLVLASFAACGNDSNDNNSNEQTDPAEVIGDIKVKISIDFPDKEGLTDVDDVLVGMTAESSVLDLLFAYANDNGLEVTTSGEGTPYVSAIGGVTESGDKGWMFTVNDETVMKSAGEAMLSDGDEVEWEFTSFEVDSDNDDDND